METVGIENGFLRHVVAARNQYDAFCRQLAEALLAERELREKYQRERAELFDKLNGTPCEQIRNEQELDTANERATKLEADLELSRSTLEMTGRCDRCGVQWNPANYGFCPVCAMDMANDALKTRVAALEAAGAKVPHLIAADGDVLVKGIICDVDDEEDWKLHEIEDCVDLGGQCAFSASRSSGGGK